MKIDKLLYKGGPTLDDYSNNKSLYQRRKGKWKIMADQAMLEKCDLEVTIDDTGQPTVDTVFLTK
jgi:hypothetical protein